MYIFFNIKDEILWQFDIKVQKLYKTTADNNTTIEKREITLQPKTDKPVFLRVSMKWTTNTNRRYVKYTSENIWIHLFYIIWENITTTVCRMANTNVKFFHRAESFKNNDWLLSLNLMFKKLL